MSSGLVFLFSSKMCALVLFLSPSVSSLDFLRYLTWKLDRGKEKKNSVRSGHAVLRYEV